MGLIANPFIPYPEEGMPIGMALEISAAANALLTVLAADDGALLSPVLVRKSTDVPNYYHLRAIGHAESALINDDGLSVLHAYIQLYMMRKGRVRSTLGVVGERLAFRSFELTLAALVGRILESPDPELASFGAVSEEDLSRFAAAFADDPVAAVTDVFGEPVLERRSDLAEVVDIRLAGMEVDVDEDETAPEIDSTVGDAPGTGVALPAPGRSDLPRQEIIEYVAEYLGLHLSPVIARGLRMYVERGLAALAAELRVTKAPRKTLTALVEFASARFKRVAIIYDGFENWAAIEPGLQETIVASLDEMSRLLGPKATFVFLLERDRLAELEERFGSGTVLDWGFAELERLQNEPDALAPAAVNGWLAAAARRGTVPLTVEDPVIAALFDEADGSLSAFASMAAAAVESSAARGCTSLDDAALSAGRAALVSSEA
jgi:hypothetical protein